MDNSAKNHAPENVPSGSNESRFERKIEERDSKEVKEAADVGRSAYTEAIGLNESVETTGRVGEVLKKSSENDGGGVQATSRKTQVMDPVQIRQNLLKNVPDESEMKRQIEREIKQEIDYLHKKAVRMLRSPGRMSYFEMTNLMKKIRDLKGLLIQLVKASLDTLKTLWLRYVHGIM